MTHAPADISGGQEGGDVSALRVQLTEYRKNTKKLRQRLAERSAARAELDRVQDELADARARAELEHIAQPRDRRALLVAAQVQELEARARAARDVFRHADDQLERARVRERAGREELAAWRVLVSVLVVR